MPQGTPNTTLAAYKAVTNITAATAGVSLKSGRGVLNSLSINTGAANATVVLYDSTAANGTGGTKLATFAATGQFALPLNWPFAAGLFVVVTGAPDVTVAFT